MQQTELSPAERESIDRVTAVLAAESTAASGTPLAAMWSDWHEALSDLAEGRVTETA